MWKLAAVSAFDRREAGLLLLDCTQRVDASRLLIHYLLQPFLAGELHFVDSRRGPALLAPSPAVGWR